VIKLTVQSDLQKAVAACEAAKGTYKVMAQSTEDQSAKVMYNEMSVDLDKHLTYLNNRVNYITQSNDLNQTKQS
jgi:rubrerythrin